MTTHETSQESLGKGNKYEGTLNRTSLAGIGAAMAKPYIPIAPSKPPTMKREGKEVYEDVDHIVSKCIDEIWDEFDDDGNGTLDFQETKQFVKHTLVEMGEMPDYSEADF